MSEPHALPEVVSQLLEATIAYVMINATEGRAPLEPAVREAITQMANRAYAAGRNGGAKLWLVRYPSEPGKEPSAGCWTGLASDPIEAAKLATIKGEFPLDCGTLLAFDQDGNAPTPVSREQRLASVRSFEPEPPA